MNNKTSIKDLALVKETGEIFNIESHHKEFMLNITLNIEDSKVEKSKLLNKANKSNNYYILSDNKKYNESELIIGLDNIRNWKLNNII